MLSAALLERWPQVCRVKITCTKLPTNRFVSTTKKSMKYVVNWIPLRIRVRSRNTQPHLNPERMGIGEWVILFSENFEGMGMGMGMGMGNSKKLCA